MIVINTVEKLIQEQGFIDFVYAESGKIYLQSFLSFKAEFLAHTKGGYCVFVDKENKIVTAFEKRSEKVWQCAVAGFPLLFSKVPDLKLTTLILKDICQSLATKTLYFPLVYVTDLAFGSIADSADFARWERLPSPIITGDFKPDNVWQRVVERYGNRANRQRNKFMSELRVRTARPNEIENVIRTVETNSWKGEAHQDMLSRSGQFAYYTDIIKSGLAEISVAVDTKDKPAAFRIDAICGNVLYVIKWSFDQNFKKYSPGFYLLTVDLFQKYANFNFGYIDLYGSPDQLKNTLETNRLGRFDFCYSTETNEVNNIKSERIGFDAKLSRNYQEHQSIKNIFNHLVSQ
jgi:hypothetical protein